MKYIKRSEIASYLNDKDYSSISITGSIKGMKSLYGWDKAKEIIRSGYFYYAIWSQKKKRFFAKTKDNEDAHASPIYAANSDEALTEAILWFDRTVADHEDVHLITEKEYREIYPS